MERNDSQSDSPDLPSLGWREWISLPDLGIPGIKAKLDTGARTSALHAYSLDRFTRDGGEWVRFGIHPLRRRLDVNICCEAPVLEDRQVSDSGGHREVRPVIRTRMALGGEVREIDMTLTNREDMLFRVLLGRSALERVCAVDPSCSYTTGRMSPRRLYGPKRK